MPVRVPAAFISYSRTDSEFAQRLAKDLKKAGANVWLDLVDIEPGHPWDNAIEEALSEALQMLLILSPASAKSNNVRNEISFALDEQKIIIPILYQDCAVPLQLHRIQRVDFRTDYAQGLAALTKLLKTPSEELNQLGAGGEDEASRVAAERAVRVEAAKRKAQEAAPQNAAEELESATEEREARRRQGLGRESAPVFAQPEKSSRKPMLIGGGIAGAAILVALVLYLVPSTTKQVPPVADTTTKHAPPVPDSTTKQVPPVADTTTKQASPVPNPTTKPTQTAPDPATKPDQDVANPAVRRDSALAAGANGVAGISQKRNDQSANRASPANVAGTRIYQPVLPVKVSSGVMAGLRISGPSPVYPPVARAAHVSGTVVLHAIISKVGTVAQLNVVSGPEMLQSGATDAVKQWTYKPYVLNGEPVTVETTITVNFNFGN